MLSHSRYAAIRGPFFGRLKFDAFRSPDLPVEILSLFGIPLKISPKGLIRKSLRTTHDFFGSKELSQVSIRRVFCPAVKGYRLYL